MDLEYTTDVPSWASQNVVDLDKLQSSVVPHTEIAMFSISTPISLNIIVVGGGIGGLPAAIAIRRAGHRVTVYEKYSADADAGAGIVVCANAARVLKQWGLDLEGAGMLEYKARYILQGRTLEILELVFGEKSKVNQHSDNGEHQYFATRQDLRMLLRNEAERDVLGEGTIQFRYSMEAIDYDADQPSVKFADETWVDSDLVVACDGFRSRAARIIAELKPLQKAPDTLPSGS